MARLSQPQYHRLIELGYSHTQIAMMGQEQVRQVLAGGRPYNPSVPSWAAETEGQPAAPGQQAGRWSGQPWEYGQLEQWTRGLSDAEAERELFRQGVPVNVRQGFMSYRQRWGLAPGAGTQPSPAPRVAAGQMGLGGEVPPTPAAGPSSPQWAESFYAEAMRYGVTRWQVESMIATGQVTQATQVRALQEIQQRVAAGYPEYTAAMQESGARPAEIAAPLRYAQYSAGLRARYGAMASGAVPPIKRATLPRTEYGEEIVPESHIMWKGREYLYPAKALEATFIGAGEGRFTATYPAADLGKRLAMTGVRERVSMAGLPEFRGPMRPGPEAVTEDIYTKIRAVAVIGGAPGPPGMGYIQRGLGPMLMEKTQEIKIQPGQKVTPMPAGEWQPRGGYQLIEGGRQYTSPWWATRILGSAPIQEERLGEQVTTGYRFHLQRAAQLGGPLAAAVKTAFGKYIYAPEELESRITTPEGKPLGAQMLTEIKDPGGYAYSRFMAEYSQAPPAEQERIAAQMGFTRGAEPTYGELAPGVMQHFATRAQEMVQTIHWQQRPFHVSQRDIYAPVIVPGTEKMAPGMGPGMRTATMAYQAMVGDIGAEFMVEYGAGTPFINPEMMEEMRRGGPEARGLAQRFEQEGARTRNAYRALYRAHEATTGQIAPERYRTLQDPALRKGIFSAMAETEAGGPADIATQTSRFFSALRTRRGAMPIELGEGTFMPAPRFLKRFSGPGVMEEDESALIQQAAFKALTRGVVSTESPEYRAAVEQYREAQAEIVSGKEFTKKLEGVRIDPRRAYGGVAYGSPAVPPMQAYVPQESMQGQVGYLWAHPMMWGAGTWDPGMQHYFMTREEAIAKELDPNLFYAPEKTLQALGRDVDADRIYAAAMREAQKVGTGVLNTRGQIIKPDLVNLRATAAVAAGAGELLTERVGWKQGRGGVAPTREQAATQMRMAWEGRQEFTTQEAWQAAEKIRGLYEAIGPRYQTMRNALAMAQSPEQIAAVEAFHRQSHGPTQRPALLEDVMRQVHTLRTFTEKGGLYDKFGGGMATTGMPGTGFFALRGASIQATLGLAEAGKLTPQQAAAWLAPVGREEELAGVITGAPKQAHRYVQEMWGGLEGEGLQRFMTGSLIGRTLGAEVAERFVYKGGKRTQPRTQQEYETVMQSKGIDPQTSRQLLWLREQQRAYGEVVGKQRPGAGRTPETYAVSRMVAAQAGLVKGGAGWLGEVSVPEDLSELTFARAAAAGGGAVAGATPLETYAAPTGLGGAIPAEISLGLSQWGKPGPRNVGVGDEAYQEMGGWKLHLATQPEHYETIDKWLAQHHRGQYKLLHGGEPGEADFTAYVGGYKEAKSLAQRMEQELGHMLTPSGRMGGTDVPFGPKVAGRFDVASARRYSKARGGMLGDKWPINYGFRGVPFDQAAVERKMAHMYGKKPEQYDPAAIKRVSVAEAERIHKFLESRYGEYYTGGEFGPAGGFSVPGSAVAAAPLESFAAPAGAPAWLGQAMAGNLEAIPLYGTTAGPQSQQEAEAFSRVSERIEGRWGAIAYERALGGGGRALPLGTTGGGMGAGQGPPLTPIPPAAAGAPAPRPQRTGGGAPQQMAPPWTTGAWVSQADMGTLSFATQRMGIWGEQLAELINSGADLNKSQQALDKQYQGWEKVLQRVSHDTERMSQRLAEAPDADPEWKAKLARQIERSNAILSATEGERGPWTSMRLASYTRQMREQEALEAAAFGGGGAGGAAGGGRGGFGGRVSGFLGDLFGADGQGRGGGLWSQMALGWTAFRLRQIGWYTYGMPMRWEQQAMPYLQAGAGFGLAMGQPYQQALAGPLGQLGAQQAGWQTFQTGLGLGAMQTRVGALDLLGVPSSLAGGTAVGRAATPALFGLGAGMSAAIMAGMIGGGPMGSAAALVGVGGLAGALAGYGAMWEAGSPAQIIREQAEMLEGQRTDWSPWARGGINLRVLERGFREGGLAGVAGQLWQAFADPNQTTYGQEARQQLQASEAQVRIQRAQIRIEQLGKEMGISAEQALGVGSLLGLAGYGIGDIMRGQQFGGEAADLFRQLAPVGRMGMAGPATSAITQISTSLGMAPGLGLRPYMQLLSGVSTEAGAAQLGMAAQTLGGAAGQVGAVATPQQLQLYAGYLARGMPQQQAQMLAQSEFGVGPISQAMGVPAGFGGAIDQRVASLLRTTGLTAPTVQQAALMTGYGQTEMGYSMMAGGWGGGPAMMAMRQQLGQPVPARGAQPIYVRPQPGGPVYATADLAQQALAQQSYQLSYGTRLGWGEWATQEGAGQEFQMGIPGDIQQAQTNLQRFYRARPLQWALFNLQGQGQLRSIDYQMQMATLQRRQALESLAAQRQMWATRSAFQRQEMGFTWQQMQQTQQWGREDIAYGRQVAGLEYGWQMEDINRGIRFATGREKEQLIRERGRTEERYTLQEERRGTEEERQEKLWQQEEERFARQQQQFEEINALEASQFEMRRKHINETYNLQMQYLAEQKAQIEEAMGLQAELRKISEEAEEERLKRAIAEAEFAQRATEAQAALAAKQLEASRAQMEAAAELRAFLLDNFSAGGEVWSAMDAVVSRFKGEAEKPTKYASDLGAAIEDEGEGLLTLSTTDVSGTLLSIYAKSEEALTRTQELQTIEEEIRQKALEDRQFELEHLEEVEAWRADFFETRMPANLAEVGTGIDDLVRTTRDYIGFQVGAYSPRGDVYGAFRGLAEDIVDWIDRIRAKLGAPVAATTTEEAVVTPPPGEKKGRGGYVSAGSSYIVGESGPEQFVPLAPGYIVPNNQLGGNTTISISIQNLGVPPGNYAPREFGVAVRRELEEMVNGIAARQRLRGRNW